MEGTQVPLAGRLHLRITHSFPFEFDKTAIMCDNGVVQSSA